MKTFHEDLPKMNKDIITIGDKTSSDVELVWFHGYGANNWGFEPFIKLLNLNLDGRLHVIMPNAPLEDGKRSWYPLPKEIDGKIVEDDEGINSSKKNILSSLSEHLNTNKRLFLGGFSQGAALALSMGLNGDINCDSVIAISGYIPSASNIIIKNRDVSVFISHGNKDTTISIDTHNMSTEYLKKNNINQTEFIDDCGHTISKPMINELTDWLYLKLKEGD